MKIVSFSLFDDDLARVDKCAGLLEVKSKSEVVRAGLFALEEELLVESKLNGHVHAAIIVLHDEVATGDVSRARHGFEDVVRTQMHTHFSENKCIETIIVEGKGEKIKKLLGALRKIKKVTNAKLVIT